MHRATCRQTGCTVAQRASATPGPLGVGVGRRVTISPRALLPVPFTIAPLSQEAAAGGGGKSEAQSEPLPVHCSASCFDDSCGVSPRACRQISADPTAYLCSLLCSDCDSTVGRSAEKGLLFLATASRRSISCCSCVRCASVVINAINCITLY